MSDWQEGVYIGDLTGAVTSQTSTGTTQMVIDFDVSGHKKQVYLYCSEKAWPFTEEKLIQLGFNGDFDNPVFTKGEKVELYMKLEEYQGKFQQKWSIARGIAKADTSITKTLSARFKASTGTPPPKPAGAPPAPPAAKGPPPTTPKGPPPKPPAKVWDKDAAWEAFEKVHQGADQAEQWQKAIDAVAADAGRVEEDFTSADWEAVSRCDIPF